MNIDLDVELKKNADRVIREKCYKEPEKISKYIMSIIRQLRSKGSIEEGDLKDLLERIGELMEED